MKNNKKYLIVLCFFTFFVVCLKKVDACPDAKSCGDYVNAACNKDSVDELAKIIIAESAGSFPNSKETDFFFNASVAAVAINNAVDKNKMDTEKCYLEWKDKIYHLSNNANGSHSTYRDSTAEQFARKKGVTSYLNELYYISALVLSGNYTLPNNFRIQAEASIASGLIASPIQSFNPSNGGAVTYIGPEKDFCSTGKDIFGNTIEVGKNYASSKNLAKSLMKGDYSQYTLDNVCDKVNKEYNVKKLTFDCKDGSGDICEKTVEVEYGGIFTNDEIPVLEDYAFIGWYDKDTDSYLNVNDIIKKDYNLEAIWFYIGPVNINASSSLSYYLNNGLDKNNSNFYTVTYDPDGGMFIDGTTEPKQIVIRNGDMAPEILKAGKEGYRFLGWGDLSSVIVNDNITLKANYKKIDTLNKDYCPEGYSLREKNCIKSIDNGSIYKKRYEIPAEDMICKVGEDGNGFISLKDGANINDYLKNYIVDNPNMIENTKTVEWVSKYTCSFGNSCTENPTSSCYIEYDSLNYLEENAYTITNLSAGSTVNSLISRIKVRKKIRPVKGRTEDSPTISTTTKLKTGDDIKLYLDDGKVIPYKISIRGDVTGTGDVTMGDVMKIARHINNDDIITGNEYILAADVTEDNKIEMNDAMKIAKSIVDDIVL